MRPALAVESVVAAVREALGARERVILAVSGGLDSMALLDAAARAVPHRIGAVATFDHGTGPHAAAAVSLVEATAGAFGLRTIVGRAAHRAVTEEAWRTARWQFLRQAARETPAVIATAHSRDDHLETVLMRVMRGSGARGIAALYAESPIVRPLLELPRTTIAAYVSARRVPHVPDPGNASRAHLRNRIRLDLLPALRAVRPSLDGELLDLSRRAARWRAELDRVIDDRAMASCTNGTLHVASDALAGYDSETLSTLWPALAGRVGAVLDRRGTRRLAAFTITGRTGSAIQLSGGWEVLRRRHEFVVRRMGEAAGSALAAELSGELRFGNWYFNVVASAPDEMRTRLADSAWCAALPADRRLTVREWSPGDRLASGEKVGRARRVKRFLGDVGIAGPDRRGWPVVLADDEIIWIPGVRRSDAATVRSGRPAVLYLCDRIDR